MSASFDHWFSDQAHSAFDSFQEEPNMAVFEQIHAQIKPAPIPWITVLQYAAVVLLIGTSLWFVLAKPWNQSTQSNITENEVVNNNKPVQPQNNRVINSIPEPEKVEPTVAQAKVNKPLKAPKNELNSNESIKEELNKWVSIDRIVVPPIGTIFIDEVGAKEYKNQTITFIDSINNISESRIYVASKAVITAKDLKKELSSFSTELLVGSISSVSENQLTSGFGYKVGAISYWNSNSKFRLGTGLALAKNNFSLSGSSKEADIAIFEVLMNADTESKSVVDNRSIQTVSLEIPLSMQYYFSGVQQKSYFMAMGLTSQIYLQERFKESITMYSSSTVVSANGDVRMSLETSSLDSELETEAFKRIDWGRLMNVSFGYAFNTKTQIEFYFSYPLDGITSRNLEYSMTGINLKYAIN